MTSFCSRKKSVSHQKLLLLVSERFPLVRVYLLLNAERGLLFRVNMLKKNRSSFSSIEFTHVFENAILCEDTSKRISIITLFYQCRGWGP